MFRKTHSLVYLLDLIAGKEEVSESLYDMAEKLESYAVEVRYPDERFEPTLEGAMETYSISTSIRDIILSHMNSF